MSDLGGENPYAALPDDTHHQPATRPDARVPPRRFRTLAVVVGLAVDIGGSQVASFAYMLAVAIHIGLGGDIVDRLLASLSTFPHVVVIFLMGASFSVLGGFVNGVIARQRELLHGAVQGAVTLVFAVAVRLATQNGPRLDVPAWYHALSFALQLPCVLLGAQLAIRRREARGIPA